MKRIARVNAYEVAKSRALLSCLAVFTAERLLSCDGLACISISSAALVALRALFVVTVLDLLGYFQTLHTVPRRSDSLIALLLFPLVFLSEGLLTSLLGFQVLYFAPYLQVGLSAGAAFILLEQLSSRITPRKKRPVRVVLDLLPLEGVRFVRKLNQLGLSKHFELFPAEEIENCARDGRLASLDLIAISPTKESNLDPEGKLVQAHLAGVPVRDYRSILNELSGRIDLETCDQWSYLIAAAPQSTSRRIIWQLKSWLEPLFALMLAVVLLPAALLAAAAVKLTSKGPVLYAQRRVGCLGREFTLYKFRSMYIDAEAGGPAWSHRNDNRVTSVGRFLRATRLDELPQLWNVMKGEMSFCGPRPERPEICEQLKEKIPYFSLRTIVKPGITGWAQVQAGYAASIEESRMKLEYDLYYVQNMSPRFDLIILVRTLLVALRLECPEGELRNRPSHVYPFARYAATVG